MLSDINKDVRHIVTDDIRCYLTDYQERKKSSKVTIDNIRRILSSFFSWLEDEDYILKSPVRRIHKVKTGTCIKETYSDETMELMRDNCTELRDLAITNLLGVSNEKKFIPSIAKIGTDLSNYNIVRTGQFAYGSVTSKNGEKISVAYLEG